MSSKIGPLGPREYYLSMTRQEREAFAEAIGTTTKYCARALFSEKPKRVPRQQLLAAIIEEMSGKVSRRAILRHFLGAEIID